MNKQIFNKTLSYQRAYYFYKCTLYNILHALIKMLIFISKKNGKKDKVIIKQECIFAFPPFYKTLK